MAARQRGKKLVGKHTHNTCHFPLQGNVECCSYCIINGKHWGGFFRTLFLKWVWASWSVYPIIKNDESAQKVCEGFFNERCYKHFLNEAFVPHRLHGRDILSHIAIYAFSINDFPVSLVLKRKFLASVLVTIMLDKFATMDRFKGYKLSCIFTT